MKAKNLVNFSLVLVLILSLLFMNPLYSKENNNGEVTHSSETWKLKYTISDKVLDAVVQNARDNWEIPSRYNGTDKCAREYIRLNLVFATWGVDGDSKVWIQSYKLDNGFVRVIWGPDSPHEELIGKKYQPEQILTESDGTEQHYYFGDT